MYLNSNLIEFYNIYPLFYEHLQQIAQVFNIDIVELIKEDKDLVVVGKVC